MRIDLNTYNKIIDTFRDFVVYKDISHYVLNGYANKNIIAVDNNTSTLICQAEILNYVCDRIIVGKTWQQIVCILDNSIDTVDDEDYEPTGSFAFDSVMKCLEKHYLDNDIDTIFKEHSLDTEQVNYRKKLNRLLPEKYHNDKVHKFTDCVYYDINGAHRDALIELFPKAKKDILKLSKKIINYGIGEFCNKGYRGTFNWITTRTRNYIDSIIDTAGGEVIYANTDGVIIHHPDNYLVTGNEIGEFKSEISSDIVYAYFCESSGERTSPYTIYQYIDKKGNVVLKGNARYLVRQGMDLSKGIVNKGKIYKDEYGQTRVKYLRTKRINVYEEN